MAYDLFTENTSAQRIIGPPLANMKERGPPQPRTWVCTAGSAPGPHLKLQDWEKTGSLERFPLPSATVSISKSKTPKPHSRLDPGGNQGALTNPLGRKEVSTGWQKGAAPLHVLWFPWSS